MKGRSRQTTSGSTLGRYADPAVLILTSLADGPKHGYALLKDIERFAGVSLGAGTLYGAVSRLEQKGLIEPLPAEDRRHPYRITANGAEALATHLASVRQVVTVGQRRINSLGLLP